MTIGDRLKALRMQLGLTIKVMAEHLGIPASSWNSVEHGRMKYTSTQLLILALHYRVNLYWLLHGDGAMFLPNDNDVASASNEVQKHEIFTLQYVRDALIKVLKEKGAMLGLYEDMVKTYQNN